MYSLPNNHLNCKHLTTHLENFLTALKTAWEKRSVPNISWSTAQEIIWQIRSVPAKNILEIGPANGFSTMIIQTWMPDTHITSIEFSRHAFEELRHNLKTFVQIQNWEIQEWIPAEFWPKVTSDIFQETIGNFSVYFGDAREILPHFETWNPKAHCERPKSILNIPQRRFEIIFIDGAFRMTREFYDLSVPLLSPGGIIIIDDVIKFRWKMNGFYEYLDTLWIHYKIIQTDPDDGIMIIRT